MRFIRTVDDDVIYTGDTDGTVYAVSPSGSVLSTGVCGYSVIGTAIGPGNDRQQANILLYR